MVKVYAYINRTQENAVSPPQFMALSFYHLRWLQ